MNHRGFDWLRAAIIYWGTDVGVAVCGEAGAASFTSDSEKIPC